MALMMDVLLPVAIAIAAVLHILLHDVHAVMKADGEQEGRAGFRLRGFGELLAIGRQ